MPRSYPMTPLNTVGFLDEENSPQRNVMRKSTTQVAWYFTDNIVSIGDVASLSNLQVECTGGMQSPTAAELTMENDGLLLTYAGPVASLGEFCIEGPVPGIKFVNGGILNYPFEEHMFDD